MELHDAVAQITAIRQQMARSATFRGYRPATTAFTGLVAIAAAVVQAVFIADPVRQANRYLELWVAAAVVSLIVVGAELVLWARRSPSHMRSEMTIAAVHSFAPCIVAGGLVTLVVAMFQSQAGLDARRPLADSLRYRHVRLRAHGGKGTELRRRLLPAGRLADPLARPGNRDKALVHGRHVRRRPVHGRRNSLLETKARS